MFVPDLVATYNLQLFSERNHPKKIERHVSFEKWSSKDRATALCLEYIVEEYTEYEEVPSTIKHLDNKNGKYVDKKKWVVQCADYRKIGDSHYIFVNYPVLNIGDKVYADDIFKGFVLDGYKRGNYILYIVGGASENGYPVTAPIRFGAKITNEKLYL